VNRFDRILVPLDGSDRAASVLDWVRLLPAREVRLFHVCADEAARPAATRFLDDVAASLTTAASAIDTRVAVGVPAERIVAEAAESDLIAMCTQGAGGGGRLVYGSVADRVARHAPVPTVLVRGGSHPVTAAPVRRIIVPLDGSAAAKRAVPMAATLARLLDVPVHLVSVSDPGEPTNAAPDLEALASNLRAADVMATTESRHGEPAPELLATIAPRDVIVATTHGHGAARRWQIGRVAERLLRHAPAPVLLMRADAP
jgi:nucleotide-binding universal stress UspA family protein